MSTFSKNYTTLFSKAKQTVPMFSAACAQFLERVTIDQASSSMINNYSRSISHVALHFGPFSTRLCL